MRIVNRWTTGVVLIWGMPKSVPSAVAGVVVARGDGEGVVAVGRA